MMIFPETWIPITLLLYIPDTGAVGNNRCSDACDVYQNGAFVDCEGRSLSHIPQECNKAKRLDMQDNAVGNLPEDSFINFTSLQHLNLRNNNMTLEIGAFHGCNQLIIVNLNHNYLPILNQDFMNGLSLVRYMHIDQAMVRAIDSEAFAELGNLEFLSLKNNYLVTTPCYAFPRDAFLKVLDLSDNSISNLPDGCFGRLPHLIKLVMQGNPLTFPNRKAFKGLKSLHILNLQNTNLTEVPTGIFAYTNTIKWLNLAFNKIRHISSRAFASLPELRDLTLQNNHIMTIHTQSFEFISSLQSLDLSHNAIKSIGAGAIKQCRELRELTLQHNLLKYIQNITLDVLSDDARINLTNNPLHCDCSIFPLWRRLKNSTETDNKFNPTCSSPQTIVGSFISLLSEDDICSKTRPTKNHQGTWSTQLPGFEVSTSHPTVGQSLRQRLITVCLITISFGILGSIFVVLTKIHISRKRKRKRNNGRQRCEGPLASIHEGNIAK